MAADDRWWGARARLQISSWRGRDDVAVLSPVPDRPAPTVDHIEREVDALAQRGLVRVLTGALHQSELDPFLAAGFELHEQLHLLRHDLAHIPPTSRSVRVRRAWKRDHPRVLDIDHRAFEPFWTLDQRGLDDAVRATPTSRFRVAVDGEVTGYAITGRAAERGYLQRLAVDPQRHRQGIGAALVADSLRWLARSGASASVVNTQEHNQAAISLYLATGFEPEPHGLTVLVRDLTEGTS